MSEASMHVPGILGQIRPLGSTGIQMSAVGQDTCPMDARWGPQENQVMLHRVLVLRCQFLDAAQEFGDGQSLAVDDSRLSGASATRWAWKRIGGWSPLSAMGPSS
jgi:hypothetical protein